MEAKFSGQNNLWFTASSAPENGLTPSWDANPVTADPKLSIEGTRVLVSADSPLVGQSNTEVLRDLYGRLRQTPNTIGAVEVIQD